MAFSRSTALGEFASKQTEVLRQYIYDALSTIGLHQHFTLTATQMIDRHLVSRARS